MLHQANHHYKPTIRIVNYGAGQFTVQSEKYTYLLYLVTLHANGAASCECEAGRWGRPCKHVRACRILVAGVQASRQAAA